MGSQLVAISIQYQRKKCKPKTGQLSAATTEATGVSKLWCGVETARGRAKAECSFVATGAYCLDEPVLAGRARLPER